MLQDILVNCSPYETRVAIVEDGAPQELHVERAVERGRVGNIYLGRVARVLPGMQSAFIDIGLERAAFLHVADVWQPPQPAGTPRTPPRPIEKQVFVGQTLLVQVIKDPIGSKGARLSTQISIAGRALVYLPQDGHIGISQKIASPQREALRERLAALRQQEGAQGGFILRTCAEEASDSELAADISYLQKIWTRIREGAQNAPPPALLHEELNLPQRVLRDMVGENTQAIVVDSQEQFEALRAFASAFVPDVFERLRHYEGARPVFDLYNVDEEIKRALGRRVELKSGGYLVIDQTEALTTIDVNTGAFVGAHNFDETILQTNLEAARAIARQLRLRNLGGIVVIDFIDMYNDAHRQSVLDELRGHLARDRERTQVGEFSPLGLVEMTRRRTRESLVQRLCEPCHRCHGSGRTRTARTVAYDALREVLREARRFDPSGFCVRVPGEVADVLRGEALEYLDELATFIGKPVSVQPDAALGPEDFDIVLL